MLKETGVADHIHRKWLGEIKSLSSVDTEVLTIGQVRTKTPEPPFTVYLRLISVVPRQVKAAYDLYCQLDHDTE